MHHPTYRITHTTAFVTPVTEHWLEREIAQWVHPIIVHRVCKLNITLKSARIQLRVTIVSSYYYYHNLLIKAVVKLRSFCGTSSMLQIAAKKPGVFDTMHLRVCLQHNSVSRSVFENTYQQNEPISGRDFNGRKNAHYLI